MGDVSVDRVIEKIHKRPPEMITKEEAMFVINTSLQILIKEKNVLHLEDPIIVVGDIHGQLYDMIEIFRIEAPPPHSQYLFLGDYVDRGYYSLEVIIYLLCLKIKFPERVHLLRGNHECFSVTRTYGFYRECIEKYNDTVVYQNCCELFNFLPLAAIISGRIFGVHGGLSPSIHMIEQIDAIDRFQEPLSDGPLPDLLWADPNNALTGFQVSQRGLGYYFGREVTKRFAHLNKVNYICRAHQLAMNGYEIQFDGLLATVWSAPNYMYRSGNLASVMSINKDQDDYLMTFNIFAAVPDAETTVPVHGDTISNYFV